MIEIRLCNVAAARWYESESTRSAEGVVPPDHIMGRFGFRGDRDRVTEADLRDRIVAPRGAVFESADLVASVAHALALAAVSRDRRQQPEAYAIEAFVGGERTHGDVPRILRDVGVYSCMNEADARQLAAWMDGIDVRAFVDEVRDMHGEESVEAYRAVARSLDRIFKSVDLHKADICCLQSLRSDRDER